MLERADFGELGTVKFWKRLLILEWKRIQLPVGSGVPGLGYQLLGAGWDNVTENMGIYHMCL